MSTQDLQESSGSTKGKRGQTFSDTEEYQLLIIWASSAVQSMFKRNKRHRVIYEYIAREHNKSGKYSRDREEVTSKIKNCKTKYNKCKPKSGDPPPTWMSYSVIHQVLGQKDSYRLQNLQDSLNVADNTEMEEDFSQLQNEDFFSENESQQTLSEQQLDSEPTAVPQNDVNLHFQRIKRPPRRVQSNQAQLVETLIEDMKKDEERYRKAEEKEARAEEREKMFTNSFNQFVNYSSMFMKCLLMEKGFPLPNNTSSILEESQAESSNSMFNQIPSSATVSPGPASDSLSAAAFSRSQTPGFSLALNSNSFSPPARVLASPPSTHFPRSPASGLSRATDSPRLSPTPSNFSESDSPNFDRFSNINRLSFDISSPRASGSQRLKIPRFSPAVMKPKTTLTTIKSPPKNVFKNKLENSKFKPKVKSNIPCHHRFRVQDVRKNLFKSDSAKNTKEAANAENEAGTDTNASKENSPDFFSVLDESFSDVEKSKSEEIIKSPLRERIVNQEAQKSPKIVQKQFWRQW